MQRLQVGLIGLLAVLIFVSAASMLSDTAGGPPIAATNGNGVVDDAGGDGKAKTGEAPVELGVTPVVTEQPKALGTLPKAAPSNPQP
jgi:hypothetical protein